MEGLAEFHFLRPWWLLGFVLLAWVVYRARTRPAAAGRWAEVCDPALLRLLLQDREVGRGGVFALTAAGTLALVALAGPVWERLPQPAVRDDAALVIALDLSRSMDVKDVSPSRLEQVRYRLVDLFATREFGFAALVAYAGRPFLVSPLTDDFATIEAQLRVLDTTTMPAGGSRADLALAYAAELLQNADHDSGEVLLVGDGLAQPAAARARARALAGQGYRVSVLGVGTPAGGPVPAAGGGFTRDADGAIVIARLQRQELQSLAAAGGGVYWELGRNDASLGFSALGEAREDSRPLSTDRWREYGPWLLLPLLLLCASVFRRGGALAALLLCCMLGMPGAAQAFTWGELWSRADQQAEQLFHDEQWRQAAQRFRDPLWRATAHYRAEDYEQALEALAEVDAGARAAYLRGNTLAMLERYAEAEAAYGEAIETAGADARLRADAQHNLEQVRRMQQQAEEGEPGESGEGESGEGEAGEGGGEAGEQQQGDAAGETGGGEQGEQGDEAGQEQMAEAGDAPGDSEAGENATAAGGSGTGEPQDEDAAGQTAGAGADEAGPQEQQQASMDQDSEGDSGEEEAGLAGTDSGEEEDAEAAALLEQREAAIQALRRRELDQATEAWLRGIRGDTRNYLRRKFHRQYQRQEDKANETETW